MISILILTFNEEANIESCIDSVSWADDIVLIDSGSDDKTIELAKKKGARVITRKFDNFANQRNYGLDNGMLKNQWVLHLDADEHVSTELKHEMFDIVNSKSNKAGFLVPSRLIFLGKWLKYSGMYPSYQVRFGRLEKLRFEMFGHGQREMLDSDDLGLCEGHLTHFNFSKGISEWIIKHAKYSKDEADHFFNEEGKAKWRDLFTAHSAYERKKTLKMLSAKLPLKPLMRFSYIYFYKKGFLDGSAGLKYAMLMACYQWFIDLNLIERKISFEGNSHD